MKENFSNINSRLGDEGISEEILVSSENQMENEIRAISNSREIKNKKYNKADEFVKPEKQIKQKPVDVIEKTSNPHFEHAFVKYPGEEIRELKKGESSTNHVVVSHSEIKEGVHRKERYHLIHTHPSKFPNPEKSQKDDGKKPDNANKKIGLIKRFKNWLGKIWHGNKPDELDQYASAMPSSMDLLHFLRNENEKYSTIATRDPETGKVLGYTVMGKTKETPKIKTILGFNPRDISLKNRLKFRWDKFKRKIGLRPRFEKDIDKYNKKQLKSFEVQNFAVNRKAFDKFMDKYHINYKFLGVEGYKINAKGTAFEKIETK